MQQINSSDNSNAEIITNANNLNLSVVHFGGLSWGSNCSKIYDRSIFEQLLFVGTQKHKKQLPGV